MANQNAVVVDTYDFTDKVTGAQKVGVKVLVQDEESGNIGIVTAYMVKSPLSEKLRNGTVVDIESERKVAGLNSYLNITIMGVSTKSLSLAFE